MIVARTYNIESAGISLDFIVPLRETPIPGDLIKLKDKREIRVLRRTFNELDSELAEDQIDVVLGVRLA